MNNYYDTIARIAHRTPDKEVCGFMLNNGKSGLNPTEVRNVSPDPLSESFEISLEDQLHYYAGKNVEALFHSHTDDSVEFSDADRKCSEVSNLPMFVYSVQAKKFNLYMPGLRRVELFHRPFIAGLYDCVQIVADYIKVHHNLDLEYAQRTYEELQCGTTCWDGVVERSGMKALSFAKDMNYNLRGLRTGDALVFSFYDNHVLNHFGVYQSDGLMIHQLINAQPTVATISKSWEKRLRMVCRPK